jgi:hypothetical protein
VERTTKGKAVPVEGKELDRLYEQGCKVIVIPDPDEPRAKYGFLIFLELDLIVGSDLGPLPANAIYGGQLFMPHDFPTAFGPCKTENGGVEEPQTALIFEEVVNMALESGVEEYRHQRNRAMLANWGVLTREQDELRTMTWTHFGFCFNIEPFRTKAVSTWVTLPGGAADHWVDDKEMDMSKALDSLKVWNTAGTRGGNVLVLPKFIQRRNFKGLDGLKIMYGDLRRMAEKADPDGAVSLKTEPATLTTFWTNNQTAPKADEGQRRSPQALPTEESSGEDSKEKTERKRKRKKEAPGEAIRPMPFYRWGAWCRGRGKSMARRITFYFRTSLAIWEKGRASSCQSPPCPRTRKWGPRKERNRPRSWPHLKQGSQTSRKWGRD